MADVKYKTITVRRETWDVILDLARKENRSMKNLIETRFGGTTLCGG
jgi:hypothetical protein